MILYSGFSRKQKTLIRGISDNLLHMLLAPVYGLTILAILGCSGQPAQISGSVPQNTEIASVQTMQDHPGKRIYDQYCKACHMADGAGIKGLQPPLIKNKTVNGPADKLIQITMHGRSGKLVIDGVEYNGIMPPHTHLSNQQIADVLTYVRQSFSNNSEPVTPDQVIKLR